MAKFRKRVMKMMKWGMSSAKISLAMAMLVLPAIPAQADDEDSHDFGARIEQRLKNSSMHWIGIQGPLGLSAPPTTGDYRTPGQSANANTAGATGYYRPEDLERDPDFDGPGARFCWTDTGLEEGGNYGEVLCAVDSAPLVANPAQRTVVVNRFVEGDPDMNQPDNFAFQPKTGNHFVIEDNPNGDIFACLPDGADRDIKTDGCVKILSVRDTSGEPTGFKFAADGRTAYLSIQHSNDGLMPKFDDYPTDDIIKITGFRIPHGSRGNRQE